VLEKNYASYHVKPDRRAQQQGGGYSEDALTTAINDSVKSYSKFLLAQVFCAAAPKYARRLLSNKDQARLTVDDAYRVFFTEHRVKADKKDYAVHSINEEQSSSMTEPEITAFRPQNRPQPRSGQPNYNSQKTSNRNCGWNQNNNEALSPTIWQYQSQV
jgi:hypothetical protein